MIFYFSFLLISGGINSQNLSDVRIYINPGHGGHDSDDRNVRVASYGVGEAADFWESESNLDKGLQLFEMIKKAGGIPFISRTTNTTEDDLPLSQIVRMANEAEADFMLSIHSNAGGKANYILQLYAGKDVDDAYTYPTATPYSDEGRAITTIIANNQYLNQANVWGNKPTVRGDKTFARTAMSWSDGYGVLRGLTVPGTISEGSMHDYNPETLRLMNMDYKWLEAWHFYKSFCEYFKGGEISTGNIVGTIHDSRNKNLATYDKIYNSKDELLALNKATVTLNPGNLTYQTDNFNNGVYVFKDLQPGTYTLKYEIPGYYVQEHELVVKGHETTYKNVFLDMERSTPPAVVAYSPSKGESEAVECVTPVVFDFNWDIDEESAINAFSIVPQIDGKISFEDSNHRMIFTPNQPYEVSTVYHVTLDKSLKHRGDMAMTEDFNLSFLTKARNRLALVASYPSADADKIHYSKQRLSFVFDQTLNTSVVTSAIRIFDKNGNEVSQISRSRLNNKYPSPLGSYSFQMVSDFVPGETYEARIEGKLIDDKGIPFFTLQTIPFKAVDVRETTLSVKHDFESNDILKYGGSLSSGVVSATAARSSTQKLFDSYSYELKYDFGDNLDGIACFEFSAPNIMIHKNNKLGIHLFGDLSGNELWIDLLDGTEIIPFKITDFNSTGWGYAEIPLDKLDNEKNYVLKNIKVRRINNQILGQSGQFYVDNLVVGQNTESGLNNIAPEKIKVYPNPVSEWLYLNQEAELKLYSLDGVLIRENYSDRLYVGDLEQGSYLIYIRGNEKTEVHTILIRH